MDPILLFLGVLGFMIISAISNILEKKQRRSQEAEARRTGQPIPPARQAGEEPGPRHALTDWQEQLRRMLNPEGDNAPPVIPPRPRNQRPQHAPAPPPLATPPPRTRASHADNEHRREASTLLRRTTDSVHDKAAALHDKVAARVEQIERTKTGIQREVKSDVPSRPTAGLRRKKTPPPPAQVYKAIQMVRDPYMVREAFVASVILGPPKALEEAR